MIHPMLFAIFTSIHSLNPTVVHELSPDNSKVPIPTEESRQFDFWAGEWDVQNRHLKPDGTWRTGGRAKAQINTVLNGRAVLEQWTGQGSLKLRGFSLRTYDMEQSRWEIALNWHRGAPSTFSSMVGNFANERGEFFPPGNRQSVRFTFSQAAKQSCQWDQATTSNGSDWMTDWIMQFSRTAPASSLDAGTLPIQKPSPTVTSKFPAARELDGLIGIWKGTAKRLKPDGTCEDGTAQRRVSSMIDGLGLLQLTTYSWGEQSIAALSFDQQRGRWFEVGMGTDEPDCHWLAGALVDKELRLQEIPSSNNKVNHIWQSVEIDSFTWIREQPAVGNSEAAKAVVSVKFERSDPKGRIVTTQNSQTSLPRQLAKARSLLSQQQLAGAEKLLRSLTVQYPKDSRPHFLLGYALHVQKKYTEAMKSYSVAAATPQSKVLAEYNMACICSLQKKTEPAFKHLNAAIQAGFKNFGQIASDPDFANIRSDERFNKLIPGGLPDSALFVEPNRIIHKFVGEAAGDQFGWTARRVGDWDKDGVEDFVATAPTHAGAGKVYVYSSRTGTLLFQKRGQPGEQFGNSAVGAGDVNNDGTLDLVVGAPNRAAPGNAYVFSGTDGSLIHHFKGTAPGDQFGYEVSELGDLDGDKHADILVGATGASGMQPKCGKVFVYSGKTGKLMFELEGERSGDSFGNAAASSRDETYGQTLAIGAQNAGPSKRGRVYVFRIRHGTPKKAFIIDGDSKSVNFGQMFISFPGDLDRDGVPDIYASDFSDSTSVRGGGKILVSSGADGKALLTLMGSRPGEGLGTSPSDAGDVNGDGVGDLVIGAWQNNSGATSGGKVYLHDGKTGRLLRAWTCKQAGDTFGFDACGIGDVDGDGSIDFLLTSAWSNARGQKTGRVFILAGDETYPEKPSK